MGKSTSEYDVCNTKWVVLSSKEIIDYDVPSYITCRTCRNKVQARFVHDSCGDYYCVRCDNYGNVKHFCLRCKIEKLYE